MSPALRSCFVIALAAVLAAGEALADEPGGALRAQIAEFVSARAGVAAGEVAIPKLDDFRVKSPSGGRVEAQLSAHPKEDFDGPTPITVRLVSAGSELKRGVVTVDVNRGRSVLVAARALPAGTVLRDSDVEMAAVSSRPPKNALRSPAGAVGQRTTRSVRAGTPLREHHVRTAPAIGRGDLVRLVLRRGPLQISALGKAREDGQQGDRVRVLNLDSRREVLGFVAGNGEVHVSY